MKEKYTEAWSVADMLCTGLHAGGLRGFRFKFDSEPKETPQQTTMWLANSSHPCYINWMGTFTSNEGVMHPKELLQRLVLHHAWERMSDEQLKQICFSKGLSSAHSRRCPSSLGPVTANSVVLKGLKCSLNPRILSASDAEISLHNEECASLSQLLVQPIRSTGRPTDS